MIFAFSTDDGALHSFLTEAEATAYAEGCDVEDGVWLFYAEDGTELHAKFSRPNEHGRFTVRSGVYSLVRVRGARPTLMDQVSRIKNYEGVVTSLNELQAVLVEHRHG